MDYQWEVLWSNRQSSIPYLPELLGISADHASNSAHCFLQDGRYFECRLICNTEDQFRIAEIRSCGDETRIVLPMDQKSISDSVQSVTMACKTLSELLDEYDMKSDQALLNTVIGNCYRIYRTVYLQMELDRLHDNNRRTEFFRINTVLQTVWDRARQILRNFVRISLQTCEEEIYLRGDLEEFMMMVLSAITICCYGSEYEQKLTIRSETCDGMVHLFFHAEETTIELERPAQKVPIPADRGLEGEKAILRMFCGEHDGKWLFQESVQKKSRSCSVQFRASEREDDSLTLHSRRDQLESVIFNKYKIMLSCLNYQDAF